MARSENGVASIYGGRLGYARGIWLEIINNDNLVAAVYIQYLQNNKILTKRLYVSSHRHKSIEKLGAIIILYVRVASCN